MRRRIGDHPGGGCERPAVLIAPADEIGSEGTAKTFDLGSFSDPGNDDP